MEKPDIVYIVMVNSDTNAGRGPMVQAPNSGFFLDEDEAWEFADTLSGIMGRRPLNRSWRDSNMGDVTVKKYYRHNNNMIRKKEIREAIQALRQELEELL